MAWWREVLGLARPAKLIKHPKGQRMTWEEQDKPLQEFKYKHMDEWIHLMLH